MTTILSKEEKERILRTLERDREFRYAMMGLLGMKEILERIIRLEERFARLEERQARLEERQQKLEERQQRLEERFAELEEKFARIEERQMRLEERQQKLEKMFVKLEKRQAGVEEELRELKRVMAAIAHRFGMLSESAFREAMKYVIEEALGTGIVERWVYNDKEGLIFGYPSVVEVDVVIKDGKHILVEVKSRVSKWDVAQMKRIRDLYEEVEGVKADAVIVGGFIDPEAWEASKKLGIEIKPAFRKD